MSDQEENRAAPSIASSMISALSDKSTPEAIFMAKALPCNIYAGKTFRPIRKSRLLRIPDGSLKGVSIRSVIYFFMDLALI